MKDLTPEQKYFIVIGFALAMFGYWRGYHVGVRMERIRSQINRGEK